MQQMIVHSRTAKNYQQVFDKLTDIKNEKVKMEAIAGYFISMMPLFTWVLISNVDVSAVRAGE